MKFVALVSGGKDSTYAVQEALSQGHELIALAHLASFDLSGELETSRSSLPSDPFQMVGSSFEHDSWMYQSVGSEALPLLSVAFNRPLYVIGPVKQGEEERRCKEGLSESEKQEMEYLKMFGASAFCGPASDSSSALLEFDVLRLWRLLRHIKSAFPQVQALVSGAILSNYQRVRIEVVCRALGWVSLSPLWQRNQRDLLNCMIRDGLEARLIKVASLGLKSSHLLNDLSSLQKNLASLHDQFGVNECGEGGEYESFTFDSPAFPHFKLKCIKSFTSELSPDSSIAHVSFVHLTHMAFVAKHASAVEEYQKQSAIPKELLANIVLADTTEVPSSESYTVPIEKSSMFKLLSWLEESKNLILIEGNESNPPVLTSNNHTSQLLDIQAPIKASILEIKDEVELSQLKQTHDYVAVTPVHYKSSGSISLHPNTIKLNQADSSSNQKSNSIDPTSFYIECSHDVIAEPESISNKSRSIEDSTKAVMDAIYRSLHSKQLSFANVYFVSITISSMDHFAKMNPVYCSYFVPIQDPPSRVTVAQKPRHAKKQNEKEVGSETNKEDYAIRIEMWGLSHPINNNNNNNNKSPSIIHNHPNIPVSDLFRHHVLHVESYSRWAPACIGPYSQAHQVLGVDHLAGQIALIPHSMQLYSPTQSQPTDDSHVKNRTLGELKWAIEHVYSLLEARNSSSNKAHHHPPLSLLQSDCNQDNIHHHIMFSSLYCSVPVSLVYECLDQLMNSDSNLVDDVFKYKAALVLRGASILKVDQLPRLACVEIQLVSSHPMQTPTFLTTPASSHIDQSRKYPFHIQRDALPSITQSKQSSSSDVVIHQHSSISFDSAFVHIQAIITSSQTYDLESITDIAREFVRHQANQMGFQQLESVFLSGQIFYPAVESHANKQTEDKKADHESSTESWQLPFTMVPVLEIGATWWKHIDNSNSLSHLDSKSVKAAIHVRFACNVNLDD